MAYPAPVEALIEALRRLPGVGRVTAERLGFHLLRDPEVADELARGLARARAEARRCPVCCNVCEGPLCAVCADTTRDAGLVAVVEEPRHVEALERAGVFRGRYHVLMGALHPSEGVEGRHLEVAALVRRVAAGDVRELILATDPDKEGEATAALVLEALEEAAADEGAAAAVADLVITRLARGLPAGSAIEYLHRGVLEDALEGRREVRLRSQR
ncbi:MAG: recombination mediator RecR [Planctomycetota bacterium]